MENLGSYAVERQIGFQEQQQQQAGGMPLNPGSRNSCIRKIIGDMASFYNLPDREKLLADYDRSLEDAADCFAAEGLSYRQQQETIQILRQYTVDQVIQATADPRQGFMELRDLLGDMESHWKCPFLNLLTAEKLLDALMIRLTVNQPILFTRIQIDGENGACGEDFLPGVVAGADETAETALYKELASRYPEMPDWRVICTVYHGDNEDCDKPFHDASQTDMMVIRRYGSLLLKQEGIQKEDEPYEISLSNRINKETTYSMEQGL